MQSDDFFPVNHYFTRAYLSDQRLASFGFILSHILEKKYADVAEIGKGSGMLAAMLRGAQVKISTIDYAASLAPDIHMDVREVSRLGKIFDCVVCAQVLEHLPFADLSRCVGELVQIAKEEVVVTIPDRRPYFQIALKLPGFGDKRFRLDLPIEGRRWVVREGAEHLWEMSRPPYTKLKVIDEIATGASSGGFRIVKHGRIPGFPIHHYFLLRRAI